MMRPSDVSEKRRCEEGRSSVINNVSRALSSSVYKAPECDSSLAVFCVEDREGTDIDGVEGTDSRVCALVPGKPVRMWGSLPGLESGVGLHLTPVLTRAGCAYLA